MDLKEYQALSKHYKEHLNLRGSPVAVKLLKDVEELDKIQHKGRPVRKLDKWLAVCQLISVARFHGSVIGSDAEHINLCQPGADSLGFEVSDYTDIYTGTYFANREAAKNFKNGIPKLEKGLYKALVVAPLEKTPVEPDVVVIFGNVAQITRLILGYLYDKGERMQISCGGGAALDADAIAVPMKTGKPNIGISCNGARMLALPNETDMVFGIPPKLLGDILEGIKFTGTHIPIGSPTRWQHIAWEPQSPVRYFLRPELAPEE